MGGFNTGMPGMSPFGAKFLPDPSHPFGGRLNWQAIAAEQNSGINPTEGVLEWAQGLVAKQKARKAMEALTGQTRPAGQSNGLNVAETFNEDRAKRRRNQAGQPNGQDFMNANGSLSPTGNPLEAMAGLWQMMSLMFFTMAGSAGNGGGVRV